MLIVVVLSLLSIHNSTNKEVPLTFYGRVVDDSGRGVKGAVVTVVIYKDHGGGDRFPIPVLFGPAEGSKLTRHVTCDAAGYFWVKDGGYYLGLTRIEAEGFESTQGRGYMFDDRTSSKPRFVQDPRVPELFVVKKVVR